MLRVFKHFGGPRVSDTEADQEEGSELSGEHDTRIQIRRRHYSFVSPQQPAERNVQT